MIFYFAFPIYHELARTLLYFCAQLFTAFLVSGSVLIPLKYVIYRQRPHQKYVDISSRDYYVTDPSFPSGHCAQWIFYSWVMATTLGGGWYLILFIAILPLIMFSRIHLGSHFPSDTLLGVVLGVGIIGIILLLAPMFDLWYVWVRDLARSLIQLLFGVVP
ncbi:MAG: PAP2 family protein [Promethearchaeota archaeon CR_4]|nr:MAG: PAP2 family protein [Candidatus Lokiarchaeota archaeon CR_4]